LSRKELSLPAVCYHPRTLRILLDYRPALRERTGVGEYAHQMASALARQAGLGDRIVLFSSSWKDRLPVGRVPGADVADARVPVSVLNLAWHRLERPPVESLAGPADVAWSMHPLLMPAKRAAQVVTIHDLYFLDHPEAAVREIRRDYPSLAAVHARRADAVVVVSEHTRAQVISRLGVAADRITVCPPGAPSLAPRPEPRTAGPILHLGTVEPRKNTSALIDAYRELRDARPELPSLVFAGRVVGPAPAGEGVRVLGYVGDEVKRQLLAEASMLVVPSLDEGFGIPALEAMTVGVPVIAAARGALPEVLGDAGVLVSGEGPDPFVRSLSSAMGRLLDDPAVRRDLAVRGMARARTFSWDASAARAREALADAVDRRKARR
jgi:glycosyltransferase involved in cell wall biosynthesis